MDDIFPRVVFKPLEHLTHGAFVDIVNVTSYQRIEVRGIGMHPYNADGVAVFFGEKNVLFIFPMAGVRVVHDDIDFSLRTALMNWLRKCHVHHQSSTSESDSDHVHPKEGVIRTPYHGGVSLHTSIYLNSKPRNTVIVFSRSSKQDHSSSVDKSPM